MPFGLFSGKSKKRRDEEDTEEYKARKKAYNDALQEQRLKNARAKGIADANKLANQKPFYQKVMGVGTAIVKDLSAPPPKGGGFNFDSNSLFSWETPKPKRKRRRKRK